MGTWVCSAHCDRLRVSKTLMAGWKGLHGTGTHFDVAGGEREGRGRVACERVSVCV